MQRTVTLALALAACGLRGLSLVAQTPPANPDPPVELKKAGRGDPSRSTDPFTAAFGGWVTTAASS